MKRIAIAALTVLLIASCALPGFAAEMQNANLFLDTATVDENDWSMATWVISAAKVENALYVLTDSTLEKWFPGNAKPERVMEGIETAPVEEVLTAQGEPVPVLSVLFSAEQQLFALDTESGRVWKLVDEEDLIAPSLYSTLDWADMLYQDGEDSTYFGISIMDMTLWNDTLLLLGFDFEKDPFSPILFGWNMASGEALTPVLGTRMQEMAPYQDGQLLCLYQKEADIDFPPLAIGIFHPQDGSVSELMTLSADAGGLDYDAESDAVYYLTGGTLRRLTGMKTPEVCAYFPASADGNSGRGLLDGGAYYLAHHDGVFVRTPDAAAAEEKPFSVYGMRSGRALLTLISEHPEVPVRDCDVFFDTPEAIMQAIQSGTAPDVFLLDSSYMPISRLMQEGYAADVSANASVASLINEMSPIFADFVTQEGKYYALPLQMDGFLVGYHSELWASIGLAEADLPKTYGELMDFAANWKTVYAKEYPDIRLFASSDLKEEMLLTLLNHYTVYCEKEGIPADFEKELFAELLPKLNALPAETFQSEGEMAEEWWDNALFSFYCNFGEFYMDDVLLPLPLAWSADAEPAISAELYVALINPNTAHPDVAAAFLDILARYYSPAGAYITLFPEHNDAIPNPSFAQEVEEQTQELAELKAQLEAAEPEEAALLVPEIENLENLVAHPEEYIALELVSAEQIQAFRTKVEPYLYISNVGSFFRQEEAQEFISSLAAHYLEGSLTGEQFLQQLTQNAQMLAAEKKTN